MMRTWIERSCVALLFGALAGCGEPASQASENGHAGASARSRSPVTVAACAGGGARLPATRLCPNDATALLVAAPGSATSAPQDCNWTVGEAAMPGGRAVLYRAAHCQSRTAKLAFVPGKLLDSLVLTASPYEGSSDIAEPIARVINGDDEDAILKTARRFIDDPKEAARCKVRAAGMEGWPADALVVDEVPQPRSDEVRSACGKFGLDEDAQTFWRLSQGSAWYFQLGQESPIVDAGSFTLITRDTAGVWHRADAGLRPRS